MATVNFNTNYYLESKLAQMQQEDSAAYGDWTVEDVQQAFNESGLTAEQHYEMYGYMEGLNPSAQFDSIAYLQTKLAQLQAEGVEGFNTPADVAEAFQAAGLSPLEHFNLYAEEEGLTATPVEGGDSGEAPEGPDAPTPTLDVAFDTSEKTGTSISWDEVTGQLSLVNEAQGDTVKHLGKDQYDANGSYPTSSDFRFTLSNQLNYDGVDQYEATFLSPVLVPTGGIGEGSVLDLRFADRLAEAGNPEATLSNTQVNNFQFTFNGTQYTVDNSNTDGQLGEARTYPELLEAIQTGIENLQAANPALSGLSVRQGSTFYVDQYDEQDELTGEEVEGISIVLSASEGELGGFRANVSSADEGGVDSYARAFDETTEGVEGLIQTTIDLSNVGYGSQGGSLNIAGESNSNVGVEKFIVNTEKGAWLTSLSSADTVNNASYNHLKEIEVNGSGYFRVGAQSATWGHSTTAGEYFTANGQTANWVSPFVASQLGGAQGLVDVQDVDATALNGSTAINAVITNAVIDRDLNLVDVNGNPADDNVQYEYHLSTGDDVLNLGVEGRAVSHEDFRLDIETGAGDDVVHLDLGINTTAQLVNQQLNANVDIDTGAGNDRVWSEGEGDAIINTGAGDDLILADNSGDQGFGTNEGRAQFVFNNASLEISDLESNSDVDLSNGANQVPQAFAFVNGTVQVNFLGYQSAVIEVASSNGQTTALQINQAIKQAINSNDVLKELLLAKDGAGNSLIVDSRIDGDYSVGDLGISINGQTVAADGTATDIADITTVIADDQYATELAQDLGTDITGADSLAESDNTINAGSGTDEIVLGTGAFSNDTVAFTGYDNGVNTIVNFTGGAATAGGTPATDEVATVTFSGEAAIGDTIEFQGVTVTLADGDTSGVVELSEIIDQLAAEGTFGDYSVTDSDGTAGTVEFTATGDQTDITTGDFTITSASSVAADSAVVDAQGDDAIAGANSGYDILDFTSYLDGAASGVAAATGALAESSVATLSFSTVDAGTDDEVTFADITASMVASALNGDNTDSNVGVLVNSIDAQTGGAGDDATNYVLMVENAANAGEYKAFALTSNAESADFSDVQLIGTMDFGSAVTLSADNLA